MCKTNIFIYLSILLGATGAILAEGWRTGSPLNIPRYGATAVALDGYIYVIGGATSGGALTNSVEKYDPASQTWDATAITPPAIPRLDAAAVAADGYIYLMGGYTLQGDVISAVEKYSPAGNSWSFVSEMRRERRGHVAVSIWDAPCVVGGIDDHGEYEEDAEWFNYNENEWKEVDTNFEIVRFKPFATASQNIMFVFGGIFNYPLTSSYAGVMDPDWEVAWTPIPDLPVARANGAAVLIDNTIYLIGGVTGTNTATARVDGYNISQQQYAPAADMPTARIAMAAAALNGEAYVAGGYNTSTNEPLSTVEIFNPGTTAIEPLPVNPFPETFALLHGYPNPFNGSIKLAVEIPARDAYQLTVYGVNGQKIIALHQGMLAAGNYEFQWNARDDGGRELSSGIYIVVLRSTALVRKLKIVYVK